MKIYVINLDRTPARLARMRDLLAGMGLDFERVTATDGKMLDDAALSAWALPRADGMPALSASEVGCILSHREAWRRIASQNDGYGLVLEDDLHFSAGASHLLLNDDWIPGDADIVKIETIRRMTSISRQQRVLDDGRTVARLRGVHVGMAAYILTPRSAGRLLQDIGAVDRAIDHILFDPASSLFHLMTIYQLSPAICIQDQFLPGRPAAITGEIRRAWEDHPARLSLPDKLKREFKRLAATVADLIDSFPVSTSSGKNGWSSNSASMTEAIDLHRHPSKLKNWRTTAEPRY